MYLELPLNCCPTMSHVPPATPLHCREEAAADAAAAAAFGAPQQAAKQAAQQPALSEDEDLNFEELVALAQPSDLALDSYSARGLLNAAPRSAAGLSSLKLPQDRFLQRYSVVSASGGFT